MIGVRERPPSIHVRERPPSIHRREPSSIARWRGGALDARRCHVAKACSGNREAKKEPPTEADAPGVARQQISHSAHLDCL